MPVKSVISLRKLYLKKLAEGRVDIKRKYVDKVKPDGSKTYRPIGAPGLVSKIILTMQSRFLQIAVQKEIRDSQHAYQPGKGVLTA